MKLDRLSVYPIRQHPAFATSAQAQFLLLISSLTPFGHTKSSVLCSVNTAVDRRFETLPSDVILSLRNALLAKLIFAVLFVNIVTLRTQRNHLAAFTFMFEQPRHAPAPLVSYKPLLLFCLEFCTQVWANDVLEPISKYDDVVAVCVRLIQLKVAAIKTPIQEVIAELERSQHCQLIHSDSDLERPTDREIRLLAIQLIRSPDLVQFTEIRASRRPVHRHHPTCRSRLFAAEAPKLVFHNHCFPAV